MVENKNISESISDFTNLARTIDSEYQYAYDKVHELDKLSNDLLHKLEMNEPNLYSDLELIKELREARLKRRYFKDQVVVMEPLVEYLSKDQNRGAINRLGEVLGRTRKQENYVQNRQYNPRILSKEDFE